ncbi:DUF86 domain-containing protein [Synechococcus sp. Nb3U1]|uniref:HepT-like ribonuclease domain-containing protein n=1 Tax=Synechococcus sp. Nb3U1 TaxID=1914529 RepID=UPI001F26289B|nr:HepT-like ribonuclease domain-containing protein [Synechococcus sp. Nb3U1]MCF2970672.1 DUF86 domain-containing protein [Synechococcus sp. Nb3U1]
MDAIAKICCIQLRGDLIQDEILYDVTLRNLQTLSEATQRLLLELKRIYAKIPWHNISDFRNILVHNYLGDIDPQIVMKVIENHLDPLESVVKAMLETDPSPLKE